MKSDARLQADVIGELHWDPALDAAHVGVDVRDGVVTLRGQVDSYARKLAAERAVQRVEGVRSVALELDVKPPPGQSRSDPQIAQAARAAFRCHVLIPDERIRVRVRKGWLTLSGELDWEFQRSSAEQAVRFLPGVLGLSNDITLRPGAVPSDVGKRIRDALSRHAEREAARIEVVVSGSTVTLRGTVDSLARRAAAEGSAWAAPGIVLVVNELKVGLSSPGAASLDSVAVP